MTRRAGIFTVVLLAGALVGAAPRTPPAAQTLVSAAVKQARAEHKTVLIEFGASWCVWCKSFSTFVNAREVRRIIADNYVILNLTVRERGDKVVLEHPGGAVLMTGWGGEKSGLPFYVFLDAGGEKIADSNAMPDGTNIGFPAVPEEVEAFERLLERTAPRLSARDHEAISAYLHKVVKS